MSVCDERVAKGTVSSHAGKGVPGLYFAPSESDPDGVFKPDQISALEKLDWIPNGQLTLHGCNTGIPIEKGGKSVANYFADRQGITVLGQKGYAYFSTKKDDYSEIDTGGTASETVYLWAFSRGRNVMGGMESGNRIEPQVAQPER